MALFNATLSELKNQGRYRALKCPDGIDLTSNDYLGMAVHPELRAHAIALLEGGMDIGAAGSRLLRGHTQAHQDLEDFAAAHFKAGKTLYFSSGFMANYALLTALPARGDVILYDALVHASMRDGLVAAKAKSFKFAHNDLNALEDLFKRHKDKAKRLWIAIESVYSMDGDIAPVQEIYNLAEKYNAMFIVDEAHGTGVFGEGGRGLCWDVIQKNGYDRLITLHTCGKAIGVAGGLVCASAEVIDYLVNTSRPFIYSTATIPLQASLVQKSLEILASDDGDKRRTQLMTLCAYAKENFGGAGTQIIPIILGDDKSALGAADALQKQGFDVRAIRPPTVPEGSARLRISLSSLLNLEIMRDFVFCYNTVKKEAA